jgi:hypothetical protein
MLQSLCVPKIFGLSLGSRLGPVADIEGAQSWGRSSPSDVRLSAIGCLRNGSPLQNAPPACGRRGPTTILSPVPTPSAAPRQFHRRPADTTQRSVFSDLRCPLSGCGRAVRPRLALILGTVPPRSQFRCQTINFVCHPTELGAPWCARPDSARIRRGSSATAPGRGPSALQGAPEYRSNGQAEVIEDVARLGARLIIQTAVRPRLMCSWVGAATNEPPSVRMPGRAVVTASASRRSRPRPGR